MQSVTRLTIIWLHKELGLRGKPSVKFTTQIIARLEKDVEKYLRNPALLNQQPYVCKSCGKKLTKEDTCRFCVDRQRWNKFSEGYNAGVFLKLTQIFDNKQIMVQILQRALEGIQPNETLNEFYDRVLVEIEEKRVLYEKRVRDSIVAEMQRGLSKLEY
ncbi:hypothetical protein E3J74_01495 [Candidatus Bathyarchaeota archaeon]|nr:MAG: hypothetical protein E3J74_01495 [Candidatus Bathyarchaeota archaeon]